jgi:hypothetical protein
MTDGSGRRGLYRVFGEEFEGGLAERMVEIRDRLDALREEWESASGREAQAEILERALDELDAALEMARDARAKVFRLEARLAARYQSLLARLRELENAAERSDP